MEATREEMKQEAIRRMKVLKMHPNPIREFQKEDKLNYSLCGMLYWIDEDQKKMVKEFEEEYGCVVYHVIQTSTTIGKMLSFLYVSKNKEEWEYDMEDLMQGCPYAYVINLDADWCSEIGPIQVAPRFGGVVRLG